MGDPLDGLTAEELARFLDGQVDYNTTLQEADGLGPIFNKESCGNCHNNPLGGTGNQSVTRFGLADKGGFLDLGYLGGSLLQVNAINVGCVETIPPEANVTSLRVTNGMLGYGLVEAILDADLLANETTPGVSGRAHIVEAFEAPGIDRVGRFGWKAQVPTLLTFSADASLMEMGLTNRFLQTENDPNGINPPAIGDCDMVADPEDGPDVNGRHFIDRVTDFQRFLAAPPQTPKSGMAGEAIFASIGCTACHTPGYTTPNDMGLEAAIRNQSIRPYSDFLLHGMGANADFIAQGDATEFELKTPPLWGVRVRNPMWHDGRFNAGTFESRVTAAIQAHDAFQSEGQASAQAFAALTATEKSQVVAFLDSLGRAEFDADGDNDVDAEDFAAFRAGCYGSVGVSPDDPCAISDVDQDGDVDLSDFDSFELAYDGVNRDCNGNGQSDLRDILLGLAADVDLDGVPDHCACPGDLDGADGVGFSDLVNLLAQWGPCTGCSADLNASGAVDFSDLLVLLANWGPCT